MDPQIQALIRNIAIAGGGALATKFGLSSEFAPMFGGIVVSLAGFAWSAWGHTSTQVIAAASALSSVQAVVVPTSIATQAPFDTNNKVISPAQAKAGGGVQVVP
jgi:hypothetical protein